MTGSMFDFKRSATALAGLATALFAGGALAQDAAEMIIWSDGPRLATFEAYDAAHDNVTFNIVTVAPADLVAKLQLAMQANSEMPDVIFMSDISYGAQLSTRRSNYLMDLTDKVPESLQNEFYPNSNSPCWINGKLLCLRNDMAHMITWFNSPQMQELGKTVPETWEEFEQLGADLAGEGYMLGSGVEPWPLVSFLMSAGCQLALPVEGMDDTLTIDLTTEECLKPAGMVDRMIANGSLSKFGPFDPDFVNAAKEGKVPLIIGPTWFGEYVIKPTYELEAGVLSAALPPRWESQAEPLTWSWGGGTYGGWKDTAYPDEVVDILMWASSDVANQTNAVTLPAHQPSALAWGEALKADEYYADDGVFDAEVDSARFSHPGYVSLRFNIADAVAKTLVQEIGNGGTVVNALPALQEELINLARLNGYDLQ